MVAAGNLWRNSEIRPTQSLLCAIASGVNGAARDMSIGNILEIVVAAKKISN